MFQLPDSSTEPDFCIHTGPALRGCADSMRHNHTWTAAEKAVECCVPKTAIAVIKCQRRRTQKLI
jgi:hypothetical protein